MEDYYDTSIALARVAGDQVVADPAWRAAARGAWSRPDASGMLDGCPRLLSSDDGRSLFASTTAPDGDPVVLQIDVARGRVTQRLAPSPASQAHVLDGTTGHYCFLAAAVMLAACSGHNPCIAITIMHCSR